MCLHVKIEQEHKHPRRPYIELEFHLMKKNALLGSDIYKFIHINKYILYHRRRINTPQVNQQIIINREDIFYHTTTIHDDVVYSNQQHPSTRVYIINT